MRTWLIAAALCGLVACSDSNKSKLEADAGSDAGDTPLPNDEDAGEEQLSDATVVAEDASPEPGDAAVDGAVSPFSQLRPPPPLPRPPTGGLTPDLWPPAR